ncbi:MAG: thiopeptide-type bacteriocin biosynthesis protein [Polyangiaceae bacterium]
MRASSSCPSCGSSIAGAQPPTRWQQTNISLPRAERACARFFDALTARLPELEARGVTAFWFLHKPPGLRLRFELSEVGSAREALDTAHDELVAEGLVESWFPSVYEPEVHQFGGPDAMELVHRHFVADSRACLAWQSVRASGRSKVTSQVVSLAAMVDLFERCIGAPEEVWDVWMNVAGIYETSIEDALDAPAIDLSRLERFAGAAVSPIVAEYRRANEALATGLAELVRCGKLRAGRRSVLPFVAIFHFNRYGLDVDTIRRISGAMCRTYDPKVGMRGTRIEPRGATP